MECRKDKNLEKCTCTYPCPTRGLCCECVKHHRENGELPGCFFPADIEKTYDRSIENFIKCKMKQY